MNAHPVFHPENTRGYYGRTLLPSRGNVGIGYRFVNGGVERREEEPSGEKIVLRSSARAVNTAEVDVGTAGNFMDHGVGIGFHLLRRSIGVTRQVGPRQTPHVVLAVSDVFTGCSGVYVTKVPVAPVVDGGAVG